MTSSIDSPAECSPLTVGAQLRRVVPGDGSAGQQLAARMREWFGAEALRSGPDPKIEETAAAWALEVPSSAAGVTVRVLADDGSFKLPLARLGTSDVFAGAASLQYGTAFRWSYEIVDGERRTHLPAVTDEIAKRIRGRGRPFEVYATHPDSRAGQDVPHGRLVARRRWRSRVFAGTTRAWWYYVPAQHDPATGSCVMVFQDGRNDLDVSHGDWWLANLTMASALEYAGYDYTTAWGNGFHSNRRGRAVLADSLRWLWR